MNDYVEQTIESIALNKFGKTENFREVLDALGVTPFNVELLPEFKVLTSDILQNEQAIISKISEAIAQANEVISQANKTLADGTEKLSSVIERISWLF
jgi:hypothetical protein